MKLRPSPYTHDVRTTRLSPGRPAPPARPRASSGRRRSAARWDRPRGTRPGAVRRRRSRVDSRSRGHRRHAAAATRSGAGAVHGLARARGSRSHRSTSVIAARCTTTSTPANATRTFGRRVTSSSARVAERAHGSSGAQGACRPARPRRSRERRDDRPLQLAGLGVAFAQERSASSATRCRARGRSRRRRARRSGSYVARHRVDAGRSRSPPGSRARRRAGCSTRRRRVAVQARTSRHGAGSPAKVGQSNLRLPSDDVPEVGLVVVVVQPAQHAGPRERVVELRRIRSGTSAVRKQLDEVAALVRHSVPPMRHDRRPGYRRSVGIQSPPPPAPALPTTRVIAIPGHRVLESHLEVDLPARQPSASIAVMSRSRSGGRGRAGRSRSGTTARPRRPAAAGDHARDVEVRRAGLPAPMLYAVPALPRSISTSQRRARVVHVHPVAHLAAVAPHRQRAAPQRADRPAGHRLLRVLPRAEAVRRPGHDHVEPLRRVGEREVVGQRLAAGVRRWSPAPSPAQLVLLAERLARAGPVHLVGRDVHDPLRPGRVGRVEHRRACPRRWCGRSGPAPLAAGHVRLGGEVHDHVGPAASRRDR